MWKWIVLSAILVHLLLIFSIFDVYYTSPIVEGIKAHEISSLQAPAKRIFIFSADGLRYDTFNKYTEKSPFLHSIIRDRKGASGLSLSHVPTESRPGHVAIFAGITEDISAVAKGWKKNPVQFDSVFNRSTQSYMWGSPDIVDLFNNLPQVQSFSYSPEEEDFASKDAANLDTWVFDRVQNFLQNGTEALKEQSRSVFFLHLLGIDTNGHGHKPYSKQYIDNIQVVDEGIKKTVEAVNNFFQDDLTAFLFTSDHGMTDWGSHGAGSNEEVLTPFIVWGAGVKKGGARHSVKQIDLTPLISTLIGIPIPVNSFGVLPIHLISLEQPAYQFRAVYANFLQLKEQIKALRAEKSHRFFFTQFPELGDTAMAALESELVKLARARRFEAAASLFSDNANSLKGAITYYHQYDRSFLGAAVSALFIAWISIIVSFLNGHLTRATIRPGPFFIVLMALAAVYCVYCGFSATKMAYVLLPVLLFAIVERSSEVSKRIINLLKSIKETYNSQKLTKKIDELVGPLLFGISMSILILAFVLTFIERKFLALIFALFIVLPYTYKEPLVREWTRTWRVLCICLLPFPFLPPVGLSTFIPLCVISPLFLAFVCHRGAQLKQLDRIALQLRRFSVVLTATAVFIAVSHYGFEKPPQLSRWISWVSIPAAMVVPFTTQPYVVDRLVSFSLSLFVPYALLSISYESLFTVVFMPIVALFVRFEFAHLSDTDLMQLHVPTMKILEKPSGTITAAEFRRAAVCVAFVLASLFGTGNFASINSFNPSTLNLFVSVFSPFLMAFLLVMKLIVPLLTTSLAMASVAKFDVAAFQKLCCIVLIITDFMSMCFFHQLKDDGSWLEIGMSISQYIVSMCISLALLLLLFISTFLMNFELSTKKTELFDDSA